MAKPWIILTIRHTTILIPRLIGFWQWFGYAHMFISMNIGTRIYADHTPVIIVWEPQEGTNRQFLWRLNNCCLEAKGVKENC